jgi:hypothetical protein
MLESKVCQYEIGYTGILLVRCGLGWGRVGLKQNSNFKGSTNNGGRSYPSNDGFMPFDMII